MTANVKVLQQSRFTLLAATWRGRLLFARQGVAERVLDWALPALWTLALVVTVVSFS